MEEPSRKLHGSGLPKWQTGHLPQIIPREKRSLTLYEDLSAGYHILKISNQSLWMSRKVCPGCIFFRDYGSPC
jgi:hypothetical protein